MNANTYLANNLPQAMGMVRSELGRDAIILSTKRIKLGGLFGLFGRPAVEVTATVNEQDRPRPRQKKKVLDAAPIDIDGTYTRNKAAAQKTSSPVELIEGGRQSQTIKFQDQLRRVQAESEGDVVEFPAERGVHPLVGLLPDCAPVMPTGTATTVVMLIGPTGGGKTSCAARLGKLLSDRYGQSVLLITTDTKKPFAVQQLKAYGDGLGVRTEFCYSGEEAAAVIAECEEQFVIVDTPGTNHRQPRAVQGLQAMVDAISPDELHLVLPCTMATAGAEEICRTYAQSGTGRLLFTKIDEAADRGLMLATAKASGLPVSYISSGQDVPGDMCEATAQDLLMVIDPEMAADAAIGRG